MIGFTIENTLEKTVTSFESWDSEMRFYENAESREYA